MKQCKTDILLITGVLSSYANVVEKLHRDLDKSKATLLKIERAGDVLLQAVSSKININTNTASNVLPNMTLFFFWWHFGIWVCVCVCVKCVTLILYLNQLQIIHSWKCAECSVCNTYHNTAICHAEFTGMWRYANNSQRHSCWMLVGQ